MTRGAWECSSGLWQAQNRRSTVIGKTILDAHCPIRCYPTGSHGPSRNPCNGNSGPRNISCDNWSTSLQFTALALSTSRSTDLCSSVCLHHNTTNKGGIGPFRLRRLQLADSSTLFLQRSNHRPDRILFNNTARNLRYGFGFRTNSPSDSSIPRGRIVLFTAEPSPNTVLLVR